MLTWKRAAQWLGPLSAAALISITAGEMWRRFNQGPASFHLLSDFVKYYTPMTAKAAERIAVGELPLWNPDACSGMPFLATLQSGVFYPGNWLAAWWPAHQLLPILVFAECVLGGVFALALFRSWGCRSAAASVGALIFTFACCLGATMWPPAIATIAWLPGVLLCVEKVVRGPSPGWWAALALATAVQILAGYPQYLVYGYYLIVPYAVLRIAERHVRGELVRRGALTAAAALATAALVGAGLAGVQLLPTAELVGQSVRSSALTPEQVHYLSRLKLATSPQVLSAALDPGPGGVSFGYPGTGYVGTASLLLIAVGLVARRHQLLPWLLLVLGAGALVLSDGFLGPYPGLYELYARIPVAGAFRSPERHLLVTGFAAAGLAALGLASLERGVDDRRERVLLAAVLVVTACASAWGVALRDPGAVWRCALALGLCVPLLVVRREWVRRTLPALLAVFLAADLVLATPAVARLTDIPMWTVTSYHGGATMVDAQQLDRYREVAGQGRLEFRSLLPAIGAGPTGDVRRISCYEPLVLRQWAELHRRILGAETEGTTLNDLSPDLHPTLYDVTSVRAVLSRTRRRTPRLWENRDALPRAYFIGRVMSATREEALGHIVLGDHDFHEIALLEAGRPLPPAAGAPLAPARLVVEEPERLIVEVEAAGAGVLVLTDSYYPGWRATVDGNPSELLLANGVQRAVALEDGPHRVLFEYRPWSFRLGAAISLISLLVVSGAALQALRHRKRAP